MGIVILGQWECFGEEEVVGCRTTRGTTSVVDSAECVVFKIDFDLLLDPQMTNVLKAQGLRKISQMKRDSRESLLDNKCLMLNHIKKNFYQVEFERNLGKNFYGEVSKLKIANWQASLEKKGAISRSVPFREMPAADDETDPQIFDYGSVQNSYDRLLILKRLNDSSVAYKNKVTGLNERKYKNDAEILAKFTKFYNLREILANRKKLIELKIEERK